MAYATLSPCGLIELVDSRGPVQGYHLRIVATHAPDKYPLDKVLELHMTRTEARGFAKAHGLELRLPGMGTIRYSSEAKAPHFFTSSSRKFHDKGKGVHALKVCRGADGTIQITNGRSYWRWTGDDLKYIL